MDRLNQSVHCGRSVSTIDAAKANDVLEHFISAGTLKTILGSYRNMCELLHLKPNAFPLFYPKLKANLNSWKAKALWKKFDARASHKCYARGKVCPNTRVLIIGAGPCGLRTAIEAQLLGAKVVVIEKRDRMSRNNVLHLWPFVIEDLRALGAKKFFGKFCAGAIDHISIRQLQCILLKVALLLGVEVYTEVSFEQLVVPNSTEKIGWRAEFKPPEHPVSQYEFDVIIGADGKRNTLEGFKRKEFRGKLAIAITANFINKRTEAEARVEEISGVAFIFNQKFFKELNSETGIDLENIVYYKDDTHYFVMTAKKPSLIDKGVIKQDFADTARLLSPDNVDRVALMNYAREAADFSTNYLMPDLEFAVNHYGQPDVAMFDFTSMYAAENASRVIERHGYKLLMILVGDSLLEPFWPTGSGCARGFLSSLDACWAIKAWGSGSVTPLEVLAERESIYRLLAQTTPENLNKDCKAYTVDPSTRYPNLNKAALLPQQVLSLYDTDDPNRIELTPRVLQPVSVIEPHRKRRRRDMHLDPNTLINWIKEQIKEYEDLNVEDVTISFKDGRVLCAILHHYRPDLLDYSIIKADDIAKNNQLAFDLLEKEIGIPPVMTGDEMAKAEVPDYLTMFSYLTQIYDTFRGEIPHIKHPKLTNLNYPPEVPNVCPFSQLSGIIQNNYKRKLYPNRFYPLSWTPLKSQILRSRNSLGFNKRSMRPKALRLQMKCEMNTKRKDDNWKRMSYHSLNKKKSLNYSKSSILNFNPIKSIEQCKENSVDLLNELNKFKSENVNENLDLERINSIKQWVAITAEYTLATSEVEEENVKCFDENFKEIKPNPTFSVTYSVEDSDLSREISRTTRNDGNGNENVTLNNNQLLDENYSSFLNVKLPNHDENINNDTSVSSDIIIRCVEENNNFISLRVLKFRSSSNTFSITKPSIRSKIPRLKQRDQVCLKSLIETAKNKKTIEDECSRISKVKQIISTAPTVNQFSSKIRTVKQRDQVCTKSSTETKQIEKPIQSKCHFINFKHFKFLYSYNMSSDTDVSLGLTYDRIVDWINLSDFKERDEISDMETDFTDKLSGITSVTKQIIEYDDYLREASNLLFEPKNKKIEERTKEIMCHCHCHNKMFDGSATSIDSIGRLIDKLKSSDVLQFPKPGSWKQSLSKGSMSEPPLRFSAITETEEADLPDIRENSSKEITNSSVSTKNIIAAMVSRSSNRPKRQAEPTLSLTKSTTSSERKNKKRRSFEKYDTGVDRENRLPSQTRGGGADEEFAARIKDLEDKWRDSIPVDKKPKDLTRSIGKIQTSDWNIREIEKKIIENKLGKSVNKEKERVPKWNREQFLARQTRLEKLDRQNSAEAKFSELDKGIKHLEQRLKEGSVRDLGQNKVATITEKLATKAVEPEVKLAPKTNSKPAVVLPTQSGSEYCHFCHKRVYLMERLSAEGRFFHRGCFKCQYCQITLRLGSYMFDRDGQYGHRFYCTQHFGMPGELYDNKVELKQKKGSAKPLEKLKIISLSGVEGVDLLDRVQTPERIEFSNLSIGHISSDHDESLSQMDEDEWTDRNFGASTAEVCSSDEDEDSSSLSGSESDDEEAYEEALEEPPTKEGTMRWMERYKQRYSKEGKKDEDSDSEQYTSSSDHSSYYENSSGDEEDEPATEGEEDIRARELRKQEVRVEPPVVHTDTGSDTEIVSDESSPESLSKHNSATEISTDSEFAVDDPTPTREIPSIIFNDFNVTKTRGGIGSPKKVQVKSGILQLPVNGKTQKQMEFTPLVPSPVLPKPSTTLLARTEGYALNRTQSTGGIATKVSLELKKKYLLGDSGVPGSIQKSGSVSTLDSKFKSFHSNISDCQKLLKPSTEISPGMQSFCNKLNECRSPLSPIISQASPLKSPDIVSPTDKRIAAVNNYNLSPEQPDITKCTKEQTSSKAPVFEHELECRPRSPVKEIPIIVPKIDWSTTPKIKDSDISSDSLTSDSESYEDQLGIKKSPTVKIFNNIPKVEIHDDAGDEIAFDSLCAETVLNQAENIIENPIYNDVPKSIVSEKKQLNQPKTLPGLLEDHVHDLHIEQNPAATSGQTTPSEHDSFIEHTTAALTETELSDWAHDSAVSDDFEDVEFELNPSFVSSRKNKQPKVIQNRVDNQIIRNSIEELNEIEHVCGKDKQIKDLNNLFNSIEFMDTGEETSSDEKILIEATMKNNGYVEFQNEDDVIEDSLNPNINNIVETVNPAIKKCLILENLSSYEKNTGYCIIGNETLDNEKNNLKETEVETLKEKREQIENEEDSLLIVESGTTTEENTCSDSTIKNMIEKVSDKEKKDILNATSLISENKTLLNKIKNEQDIIVNKEENSDSCAFEEHCKRLQSKVEFGNVRDSIDIRKSKRKDKIEIPPKPDLIQEEVLNTIAVTPIAATTTFTPKSLYTKEEIQKARDENQRLVQEMVMNKMKAENKSLERKKRNRNSFSPIRPSSELNKSEELEKRNSMYLGESSVYSTPDVLLTTQDAPKLQQIPLEKSRTTTAINELNTSTPISLLKHHPKSFNKQLSIHQTSFTKSKINSLPDTPLTNPEAFSLPDIQQALLKDDFKFSMNSTERLKYEARLKAQSKSNKDLGMSPEDKFKKLREKILRKGKENENLDLHIQDSIESLVINREKRNSLLYSNDTLTKRRNNSFRRSKSGEETLNQPVRTKSVSEISKSFGDAKLATINFNNLDEGKQTKLQFCKSDSNLLAEVYVKAERKSKSKDHDGRKSITKLISDFFGKKDGLKSVGASGQQSKSFLSRISLKSKSKDKTVEEAMHRTHSFSEKTVHRNSENASPPPIPPLPLNYTGSGLSKCTDESSDGELGQQEHSSCDTLDQSGIHGSRRSSKNARRASRQAQLKRHRMAQEIQRKLEETEVKTRELEQRGVMVEKALRGEAGDIEAVKEESELLKEWFDLMRDLTELRRYERELMVQAQELELEDSHARLQQELRERLENEDHKTKEDAKVESKIINEMMEIVAKRDSLIALLEQDRLRYSEEDHDFEEQMLAKGLRLTPLKRTSNK